MPAPLRRASLGLLVLLAAAPLVAAVSDDIKIDQVGYTPDESKLAMITAAADGPISVRRASDGGAVFRTNLSAAALDAASGDQVRVADFSPVTAPGDYYLDLPGVGQSYRFRIAPDVYRATWRTVMRGFYAQRCGIAVDMAPDYPAYHHDACHLDDAVFDPSSGRTGGKAATGGWHDAGDYGKYVINANISVGELLWAYERYPGAVAKVDLSLPESGKGLPDILNEARWELTWMATMQDDDGGVWEKLTSPTFGGFTLPEHDNAALPRLIIGGRSAAPFKDSGSTAGFAAVMAIAARVYKPFDPAYAAACLEKARRAYAWAQEHPCLPCANPPAVRTGNYCNTNPLSARLWAAAELLRSTDESAYRADFEAAKGLPPYVHGTQSWKETGNLAMWAYTQAPGADPGTVKRIESDTLVDAEGLLAVRAGNGYRNTLGLADYTWGSNGQAANMSLLLLVADRFSPKAAYVQAAADNIHYVLGRNCFNTSWVTQVGSKALLHPHHRPSGSPEYSALPPWPGLLSGGPNFHGGDPGTNAIPPSVPPMRHWLDRTQAYSSNEICINWQAPLVYVLAALVPPSGGMALKHL
jgi:endoglucanase